MSKRSFPILTIVLVALLLVPLTAAPLATGYAPAELLGNIHATELAEISGIAASRQNPGVIWAHNDSGDGAYLYATDLKGNLLATYLVRSAAAVDWEDMAIGPGPDGQGSYLYMGDIGDNDRVRTDCAVYRIPEPKIGKAASSKKQPLLTDEPTVRRTFAYEDGPRDAESLLVHPRTGDIYIVSKEPEGQAGVYKFARETSETWKKVDIKRIASLKIDGVLPLFRVLTGGEISPDASRVILRSYEVAYELRLPESERDFDQVWNQKPRRISTPPMNQGEAICYGSDGVSLVLTSEKLPAPLYMMKPE